MMRPLPARSQRTGRFPPIVTSADPTPENVLKHPGSHDQPSLRMRRSGHLVKLQVALWKMLIRELLEDELADDSAVQVATNFAHGVQLTMLSIQKLFKCAQSVYMGEWMVAFLDCRR